MAGTLIHGSGTKHYLDEVDVSCALNSADLTLDREIVDARAFCGNQQVIGRRIGATMFAGFGAYGADEYEYTMSTLIRSGADCNRLLIMGSAAGARAYEVVGPLTKDSHPWSVDAILGLNGEIAKGTSTTRALVLNLATVSTGTGAQTGQSHEVVAALTTTVVTIRVTAFSGAGTITFAAQESQDDAAGDAWATMTSMAGTNTSVATISAGTIAFTGKGTARMTTTSATELWKRINVTGFSGLTSATWVATVGVQVPA